MKQSYLTTYQPIGDNEETLNREHDDDLSPEFPNIHVVPKSDNTRWNHVEDLDSFFTRVYQYHQQNGFLCMMAKQVLDLVKFVFIVLFTVFIICFVNYDILFRKELPTNHNKTTISDCIKPFHQGVEGMSAGMVFSLIAATLFWILRVLITVASYFQFCDIKKFYNVALGISDNDLVNVTWCEVQKRLMEVQVEQRMCIHKESLTELDIYHRILRFNNYFIAMVNKGVIPLKFHLPFLGEVVFLSRGLRYNIEMILFSGIGAPFKNNWHLDDDFKRSENRHRLAEELKKRILYVGILNFVLAPFILLFQILRSFYHYTGIIRREPGFLGVRRWSHYGEATLRHYNELEHELRARLNRGYRCSAEYMNSFTSALGTIVASHVAFISGAIVAVLAVLTIYDEDVIQVEHVLTLMTVLAAVAASCQILIPRENLVWCPELLMKKVLAEVHYLPDAWRDKAHTSHVRREFSQLFQYKLVHLIESLVSPLVTPILLCFRLRLRSLEIVDFLRNFTVEVVGVGDICSFAQMDLRRHGSRTWHPPTVATNTSIPPHEEDIHPPSVAATDNGKTELSLLHFALTNPSWRPPQEASDFLHALRSQARKDFDALQTLNEEENALFSSINSVSCGVGISPIKNTNFRSRWTGNPSESVCGRLNHLEGSRLVPSNGILGSLTTHTNAGVQGATPNLPHYDGFSPGVCGNAEPEAFGGFLSPPSKPQDMIAIDMSVSTLYLHELHQRRRVATHFTDAPMRFVGAFAPLGGGGRLPQPPAESYYHSTDPPSADGSLHPLQGDELNAQRYRENTPLIKPRT